MPRHQYSDSSTTVSTVNNSCRNNIISNSETHTLIFFSLVFLCPFFSLAISYIQTAACMQAYMRAHGQFSRGFFFNSLCRVLLMQLHKVSRLSNPTLCWHNQIHPNAQHMEIDNNGPSKTFQHTDTYYIKCAQLFSLTEFFPLVWPIPALQ